MKKNSFVFLGDVFKIKGNIGISLFDDYELKKPNKEQLFYIKKFIDNYRTILSININRFEYKAIPKGKSGFSYVPLDKRDWNYWVIEHSKIQMGMHFPLALGLSSLDLTVLFEGTYSGLRDSGGNEVAGIMGRELTAINFFHDTTTFKVIPKEITNSSVKELQQIHSTLKTFEDQKSRFGFIEKAMEDFMRLKDISEQSPFKILGYFSIMELLLTTYKPRNSNDSSISNQLQKKINLINNQLEDELDFKSYFKGSDTNTIETIIEKLYQYRNDIAHGNKSDFENELKILKNKNDDILGFLKVLLRKLIIKALDEPQLIRDLKEC